MSDWNVRGDWLGCSVYFINDAARITNSALVSRWKKKLCRYPISYVFFIKFCHYNVYQEDRLKQLYVYHDHCLSFSIVYLPSYSILRLSFHFLSCVNSILSFRLRVLYMYIFMFKLFIKCNMLFERQSI